MKQSISFRGFLPERGPLVVSACLVGFPLAYDGRARLIPPISGLLRTMGGVSICPEQLGGLPTPRMPAEIRGGDGLDVLEGRARVYDRAGKDVTEEFLEGARRALGIARSIGATAALLRNHSPSCGVTGIYDGSFSGRLLRGPGVTAALLRREGVRIYPREEPGLCRRDEDKMKARRGEHG